MRKAVVVFLSMAFVIAAEQAVAKGQKSSPNIKEITVTKKSDSSSNTLMRQTGGSPGPKGTITHRKAGKGQN